MRPVIRGEEPQSEDGDDLVITDYKNARGELIERMGEYCSYCEMHLDSSLAVEHVQPKKPDGAKEIIKERELSWDNFLLACTNCNSTKSNTDVRLGDYFWPDKDNTFLALSYSEGGIISPAQDLTAEEIIRAEQTIKLTGLDKRPLNNPQASDRRWKNRRETWDMACLSRQNLQACDVPAMRDQIVLTATGHAYWSIWMTVFKDDADMLRRLIKAFPGTCESCFDAEDSYKPMPRTT